MSNVSIFDDPDPAGFPPEVRGWLKMQLKRPMPYEQLAAMSNFDLMDLPYARRQWLGKIAKTLDAKGIKHSLRDDFCPFDPGER